MDEKTIRKIEGHLRGTFANARITLQPRPKQKDSAEVYIGEEFVGVRGVDRGFAKGHHTSSVGVRGGPEGPPTGRRRDVTRPGRGTPRA